MKSKITIAYNGKQVSAGIDTDIMAKAKRKNSSYRKIISDVIVSLWGDLEKDNE
jgi:hypothetical protein